MKNFWLEKALEKERNFQREMIEEMDRKIINDLRYCLRDVDIARKNKKNKDSERLD